MMTDLFVTLKIPDTTAITVRRTLERMGYKIPKVTRYMHYRIDAPSEVYQKASTCDVLVNVNKHVCTPTIVSPGVKIRVSEGESARLATTLRRLGINATSVTAATVWLLETDEKTATRIARELLCNENYQSYEVLP